MKQIIFSDQAPKAIGPYSQAVKVGNTIYLSGQIPLDPATMEIVSADFHAQAVQVFENLRAVCKAAGSDLADIVKLTIYLTDLSKFNVINEVMTNISPHLSGACDDSNCGITKSAQIEIDGIIYNPLSRSEARESAERRSARNLQVRERSRA